MCLILSLSIIAPLMRLEVFSNEIKVMEYGIRETMAFIQMPSLPDAAKPVNLQSYDITLNHVSFRYTGNKQKNVLHGIDLFMPQGSLTALVGTSGGGKYKENIRLGNPQASDEQVYQVARAACCDDFIRRLEQGYDTPAGKRKKPSGDCPPFTHDSRCGSDCSAEKRAD